MNITRVGEGKVVLIAGGGKIYTDVAARFCGSEKSLEEIVAAPYDKRIVKNILDRGHLAATEFDWFIFGVEGYSRVTEVQLMRNRISSYLVKSGRKDKGGKRSFDVVLPDSILGHSVEYGGWNWEVPDIVGLLEKWYVSGVNAGLPEEDLRYLKPQATEFKALIGKNARQLLDFWKVRCCMNAQAEIRDLAVKTRKLALDVAPDLFEKSGANCAVLGYCPENSGQHPACRGVIPTHEEVMRVYRERGGQGFDFGSR